MASLDAQKSYTKSTNIFTRCLAALLVKLNECQHKNQIQRGITTIMAKTASRRGSRRVGMGGEAADRSRLNIRY